MNERIEQLAEQANAYAISINPKTAFDKKFAELLIKECIQVSEAHAKNLESQRRSTDSLIEAYEDGIVNGIYEATETIKQHFGIEE